MDSGADAMDVRSTSAERYISSAEPAQESGAHVLVVHCITNNAGKHSDMLTTRSQEFIITHRFGIGCSRISHQIGDE